MDSLIFIDTNILLDFYRVRGRESDLSILDHINNNHSRIITSSQVEMEFKKNRPAVIVATLEGLKSPQWGNLNLPAYLAKSKQSSALEKGRKRVDSLLGTLRNRTRKVLENPTRNDPVYKVSQRLFRAKTDINLSRDKKIRFEIRRLARKRFVLGYPPRKPNDTSIGDAINWEWVVRCAKDSGKDVVIVSRDSDYGTQFKDGPILNDWLRQEFRERVARNRKIILTDRLTVAFREAEITVTPEEEKAEDEFLRQGRELDWFAHLPAFDLSEVLRGWEALAENPFLARGRTAEIMQAFDKLAEHPIIRSNRAAEIMQAFERSGRRTQEIMQAFEKSARRTAEIAEALGRMAQPPIPRGPATPRSGGVLGESGEQETSAETGESKENDSESAS